MGSQRFAAATHVTPSTKVTSGTAVVQQVPTQTLAAVPFPAHIVHAIDDGDLIATTIRQHLEEAQTTLNRVRTQIETARHNLEDALSREAQVKARIATYQSFLDRQAGSGV